MWHRPVSLMLLLSLLVLSSPVHADTWAIYWYVCGSDLETRFGAASNDIVEAANADYADEVTMVLQTGGSNRWDELAGDGGTSIKISPKHLERYLFNSKDTLTRIQRLKQGNMGHPQTLSDFLKFCLKNYPADHKVLIIWDHGGGSAGDLANDQNFNMRGLKLADLRKALADAFGPAPKQPPLDIIGFDACLMATLDVGMHVHKYARYMVASEETEPGVGWNYSEMISQLSAKTSMPATDFGKIICDTYLKGCIDAKEDDYDPSLEATLSVVDLAEIPRMKFAWNILGMEAVNNYIDQEADTFLTQLGRAADRSEKFLNSKTDGYSNMLDMGSFVKKMEKQLPETSKEVYDQLQKTVVYRVSGTQHSEATGLSCYYPFDGGRTFKNMLTETNLSPFVVLQGIKFQKINGKQAEQYLTAMIERLEKEFDESPVASPTQSAEEHAQAQHHDGVDIVVGALNRPHSPQSSAVETVTQIFHSGAQALSLPGNITQQIATVSSHTPQEHSSLDQLKDAPIKVDDEGNAVLDIGKDAMRYVESVYFYLGIYDEEKDLMLMLGKDADMYSDYEKGVFRSHFINKWATLNGHVVTIEVTATDEGSFYYTIPLKLNSKRVNLYARYDLESSKYYVIGAREVLENETIDKMLIKVKKGDSITTIFSASRLSDNEDFKEIEMDTFTIDDKIVLADEDMGDCNYFYMFEMNDLAGNTESSDVALISVKNGEISIKN